MNRYHTLIIASVLAVFISGMMAVRSTLQKRRFDRTVNEALRTSEGYDQKFIDMVNRLENELALRASFGYIGRKDPMTGKERIVVNNPVFERRRSYSGKSSPKTVSTPPAPEIDSVKLTAIIFDDEKKLYTAIVMVGERSFAIEVGDLVVGRRITIINNERVVMEDDTRYYIYEITGRRETREKADTAAQ